MTTTHTPPAGDALPIDPRHAEGLAAQGPCNATGDFTFDPR